MTERKTKRVMEFTSVFFSALLILPYDQYVPLVRFSGQVTGDPSIILSLIPAFIGFCLLMKETTGLLPGWKHIAADVCMGLGCLGYLVGFVFFAMETWPPNYYTALGLVGQLAAIWVLYLWIRREETNQGDTHSLGWKIVTWIFLAMDGVILLHRIYLILYLDLEMALPSFYDNGYGLITALSRIRLPLALGMVVFLFSFMIQTALAEGETSKRP